MRAAYPRMNETVVKRHAVDFATSERSSARATEVRLLLLEGKTLVEICDLLGFTSTRVLSHFMKRNGISSPYRGRKKHIHLTPEQALTKLLALRKNMS